MNCCSRFMVRVAIAAIALAAPMALAAQEPVWFARAVAELDGSSICHGRIGDTSGAEGQSIFASELDESTGEELRRIELNLTDEGDLVSMLVVATLPDSMGSSWVAVVAVQFLNEPSGVTMLARHDQGMFANPEIVHRVELEESQLKRARAFAATIQRRGCLGPPDGQGAPPAGSGPTASPRAP